MKKLSALFAIILLACSSFMIQTSSGFVRENSDFSAPGQGALSSALFLWKGFLGYSEFLFPIIAIFAVIGLFVWFIKKH